MKKLETEILELEEERKTIMEYAAKFISTQAKKKALAVKEMNLLSKMDHERVLFFHDAFEKKNAVIIITELYPYYAFTIRL